MTVANAPTSAPSVPPARPDLLILKEITKAFPGVLANDRVTFEVRGGEVHALLGENGAGKTTLMNVLYGIHQPDGGEIWVGGRRARIRSPRDAIALGIGMVPQHFLLVGRHTVAENIALGMAGGRFLFPARRLEATIRHLGARYGLPVDPRARVWALSAGERQRVEILKVLIRGATILILDEPTSVLTPQEARSLFGVLDAMRREGHAVIFITHKLDEVLAVADRVTVLRRGRLVGTVSAAALNKHALARMMVGRDVEFRPQKAARPAVGEALVVEDLAAMGDRGTLAVRGISLTVHRGEILGVAGIAGNGQRELVEALAGLRPILRGRIRVMGEDMTGRSPREIAAAGVAHIPEDRVGVGIVPGMTVAENLALRGYRHRPFSRGPVLDLQAVDRFAREAIAEYGIAAPGPSSRTRHLSGGNIQKLILARELASGPGLILASHPTSGLDVGAAETVQSVLLRRRDEGAGVLLVSEDLEEILALSDRIAVLFRGEIVGVLAADEATPERLGLMMMGQRT